MAQDTPEERPKLRFGLHINVYVGATVVVLCLAVFVASALLAGGADNDRAFLLGGGSGAAVFVALLCLVGRYCSSQSIAYWEGLKLASHFVSIGVGGMSMILSFIVVTALILMTSALSLIGLISGNRLLAQRTYVQVLNFLGEHRMYQ
jgi:hypothetical protein